MLSTISAGSSRDAADVFCIRCGVFLPQPSEAPRQAKAPTQAKVRLLASYRKHAHQPLNTGLRQRSTSPGERYLVERVVRLLSCV